MDRTLIEKSQALRKEGKSYGEIGKELLITKSKACYCCSINLDEYDEKKSSQQQYVNRVCELAKKCTNVYQILKVLGKKGTNEYYKQIWKILKENNIDTSHFVYDVPLKIGGYVRKKPIEEHLVSGSTISSTKLRNRLLNEGIKEYKCERCGRIEWEGEPIPLQLHHINGDHNDSRIENLQLLCPNCHALTDTYCRNRKKIMPVRYCSNCGKMISRNAVLCKECYQKLFKDKNVSKVYTDGKFKVKEEKLSKIVDDVEKTRKSKCPQKEELINTFKECGSFIAVGKKYGVSDKAVCKWCYKLSLPTKAKEMRQYLKDLFGKDLKWNFTKGNANVLRQYQIDNLKRVCLLDNDGTVEKIYTSLEEVKNDGFNPKCVYMVCKGQLNTHQDRIFKFLEEV